jgi:hypothetical protein
VRAHTRESEIESERDSEIASESERRREIERGGRASERKMIREAERHQDELGGIRDKETVGYSPKP